ncbi:hypothetical protein IEQ34_014305 [Dendrobium chrysotoxum]|uniref:C2 NT-type domain-containing protein n=1 Tax=Dendrobium chrysotoxum TaxID=161865 RepID=A0AAV7GLA8_DENCH|nr:hypothetical protein IEQ34_014305 [Dendrobium chrysotoxum]
MGTPCTKETIGSKEQTTMHKETRNKIRTVFKLQFHVTQELISFYTSLQVDHPGWEIMMVSLVPMDIGKATMKTDKVLVIGGNCYWRNPIYETVKLFQDSRTGRIHDKLYNFVVSANGSATAAVVGEVGINLSDYFDVIKPAYVSLPLKPAKSGVILHVTIQKMHADLEVRGSEKLIDAILLEQSTKNKHESNKWEEYRGAAVLRNHGSSATNREKKIFPSKRTVFLQPESRGHIEKSNSSSSISTSSSDSSGQHRPKDDNSVSPNNPNDLSTSKQLLSNNGTFEKEKIILDYLIMEYGDHQKSTKNWHGSSAPDGAMANSNKSYISAKPEGRTHETSAQIEKYRDQSIAQTQELELSESELQNLHTIESNRWKILLRKLNSLQGERDALKRECEELKASQRKADNEDDPNKLHPHSKTPLDIEEIKQELQYERSINANLRLQLHKTQEANSELILAVQDLEELLEQENSGTSCINCTKISIKRLTENNISETNFNESNSHLQVSECEELFDTTSDGDDEQHKLDVLVKRDKAAYSLQHKMEDLNSEIYIYKTQQEDMQMKMKKLDLDHENPNQENNNLYSKLEQAQPQDDMGHDKSEHSITANYLEDQVKILIKELQEQSRAYEANLEDIMKAKLQEEKRATQAEEKLQLTISNNVNIAEKLQEEFITLAREISSTFHINEKIAIQALAEANEMQSQKCHLENLLEQTKEDFIMLQHGYDVKLMELSDSVDSRTKEIERLLKNLKAKSEENDNQKKSEEIKLKALTEEILMLETKVKMLSAEKVQLSELMGQNQRLATEMEQLKMSNKEIETKLHERSSEKEMLDSELSSMKDKAIESEKDLQKLQQLLKEKDIIIKNLNADVEMLRERSQVSNNLLVEDEMENENLRKQTFNLQSDLRKRDEKITSLEKKLKERTRSANSRANVKIAIASNKTYKPDPTSQGSKEVTILHQKIKLLEASLLFKNSELEETRTSFLQEEKNLNHRIEELEKKVSQCKKQEQNVKHNLKRESANSNYNEQTLSTHVTPSQKREEKAASNSNNQDNLTEMLNEMMLLKENSKAMEAELKEMQQRYTEISLRFAEVEGERQQLVMTVRNLKNTLKT